MAKFGPTSMAASAAVGLLGKEGLVILRTGLPFLYYALLAGGVGFCVVWMIK